MPPISLRSVDEPLTAANVDAAPTRRDATGPLVSVLMTTYNSEATIGWSVASVLAQSHGNIELIVVDDASRDRTFAVLSAMAQADPRLRVERMPENAGTYVARNTGMRLAGGALVTCQDADDWAHPEKIAVMVARLAAESDLVATGVHHVRVSGERGFQCRSGQYTRPDASSLMFRREAVVGRIGYFDSVRSGADSEFTRRLQRVFGRAALSYCAELLSVVSWSATTLSGGGRFAIDDDTGVMAPLRNAYRASYTVWHETASGDLYLPFPLAARPFAVPDEMMRGAAPSAQGAGMPTEP
jgi:glycosyltransferase involved in cell wall biosynthesis